MAKQKHQYIIPAKLPPDLPPGIPPHILELSMESMVQDTGDVILQLVDHLHDPDKKQTVKNFKAFLKVGKNAPRETDIRRILGLDAD